MNILVVILLIVLLFGGSGYVGMNHGWNYGGGVSILGLLLVLLVLKILGII